VTGQAAPPDLYQKGNPVDDQTVPELTGYQATAADLRRIADGLDTLPPRVDSPYLSVSILPAIKTVEEVDAIGNAIFGKTGETSRGSDGWRHQVQRTLHGGRGYVAVHALVSGPPDERDVELAQLRARVAELEGDR
jgi:hypothetical protein